MFALGLILSLIYFTSFTAHIFYHSNFSSSPQI